MKIFENLNFFRNNHFVTGVNTFKDSKNTVINPTIYTGDYSVSMFNMNLEKTINQQVGQNLYYLS